MSTCPCGSGQTLEACCGQYIDGTPAPTAEAMMRSRYTAYTLCNGTYLEKTLSAEQRTDFSIEDFEAGAKSTKWQGLEIRKTNGGGEKDETGTVEFVAKYRENNQQAIHHELAIFKREDGNWVFADCQMNPKGEQRTVQKVGRNNPCSCGSGKKFKKCCG